jgi:probable rRNA maturation factor
MLTLQVDIPHADLSLPKLRRSLSTISLDLQIDKREMSIVIVSDKSIRLLNNEYRKLNKPTDVLSFAMSEGDFAEISGDILGDIIVSLETARRQAREKHKSIQEEVTFLVIHGLLHLLGFDHQTDREERVMNRESARLLKLLSPDLPAPKKKRSAKTSVRSRTKRATQ